MSIDLNRIYNEDCRATMRRITEPIVDVILTSPFYNTSRQKGKLTRKNERNKFYPSSRYDTLVDTMNDEEYSDFTKNLFNQFDSVLKKDGVVLYNISYGSENTDGMFKAINTIITGTKFSIADVIIWKKRYALPNNVSPNKLTRITEFVFVLCRKNDKKTFRSNKRMLRVSKRGQAIYENIFNFIEAPNNDETCPILKATYSSELCEKLLSTYAPLDAVVYDPFIGSGTTAIACLKKGLSYIGSEISEEYCKWAENRIRKHCFAV